MPEINDEDPRVKLLTAVLQREIGPYVRPLQETLKRIHELIKTSEIVDSEEVGGDVLRAAVVLMHACFEDLVRTVAENLLPITDQNALREIALVGSPRGKSQFQLAQLFAHRGKTVDQLIKESVVAHLERSTFNSMTEVCELFERLHISLDAVKGEFAALDEMMMRRHQIVHRADKVRKLGSSAQVVAEIGVAQVTKWLDASEAFLGWIISSLTADVVLKGSGAEGYRITIRHPADSQ
jgi:hypothetical protein